LLRFITRRYKSFKSLVAKGPPCNGTNGHKSGGNTGHTFKTIQSGRDHHRRKPETILKPLANCVSSVWH
jgi:hypothetical protein